MVFSLLNYQDDARPHKHKSEYYLLRDCPPLRPSVRLHETSRFPLDELPYNFILRILVLFADQIQFWLKREKYTGHSTWIHSRLSW